MTHAEFTDKTIPIACAECNEMIEGVDAMEKHITKEHKTYSVLEAPTYARLWADDAYAKDDDFKKAYDECRKLEKSIDADIEFQEHKENS